jgi:beta-galactosidase
MLDLMAWHLAVQGRPPNLAGTAQWVFSDFGTPLRPENPIPYINQKGLTDRAGRPKDVYYLFKAVQAATPVLYIESETWPIRTIHREAPVRVRVITNCQQVELFLDGASCGVRSLPEEPQYAATLWWELDPQPGEHVLHAVGNRITHTIRQTWVEEHRKPPVRLVAQRGEGYVVVQLVDADEHPVTGHEARLQATSGRRHGTPDGSRVVETANGRAIFALDGEALTITPLDTDIPPLSLEAHHDHK